VSGRLHWGYVFSFNVELVYSPLLAESLSIFLELGLETCFDKFDRGDD
jgi:hypothetical protein